MNTLALFLAAIPTTLGGWLNILFIVAIAAVVIWGLIALYKWAVSKGVNIPEPVRIIFICLLSIGLIILMFRLFGVLT